MRHNAILGKILSLSVLLILTGTLCTAADTGTRRQLFDFGWKFSLGDPQDAGNPDYDDSAWRTLDLPHDWSIEGNISPDAPTGNDGGYFPAGTAWYRKAFDMPAEYRAHYQLDSIQLPPNFLPEYPFDNGELKIRDEVLAAFPRTKEEIRQHLYDYYAMISHVDKRVGEIVAALKETGLYDNTIIIFAGDNGLAVGQHGLMGKQSVYEHSVRVPLIIKEAGKVSAAPRQTDKLCYLIDLFPTLCELTGTPIPDSADGRSLLPVLRQDKPVRDYLYYGYRFFQRAVSDALHS